MTPEQIELIRSSRKADEAELGASEPTVDGIDSTP